MARSAGHLLGPGILSRYRYFIVPPIARRVDGWEMDLAWPSGLGIPRPGQALADPAHRGPAPLGLPLFGKFSGPI